MHPPLSLELLAEISTLPASELARKKRITGSQEFLAAARRPFMVRSSTKTAPGLMSPGPIVVVHLSGKSRRN
jgi:hypothetical protein